MELGRYYVVTTIYRGVFFGKLTELTDATATLDECQNCVSWGVSTRGFLGLAANGPDDDCRVGPFAPTVVLYGVTSISKATKGAVERWKSKPWK